MAKKRSSNEAVYKVVEVVGTSPVSWEDAARRAGGGVGRSGHGVFLWGPGFRASVASIAFRAS